MDQRGQARRRFLASAGAAVTGSLATAGCLGDGTGGSDEGESPTATESATRTPTETASPTATPSRPTVTSRSFERLGDADTQSESADVAFSGTTVTCTGVIVGRNGCQRAALAAATYDPEADELRVRVTTETEGDVCTQQLVYRRYEAVVGFENALPGRVVVEHESMGEVRTVREVTR